MKFQVATTLLALASSAAAACTSQAFTTFKLKAVAVGSEVNNMLIGATVNDLFAGLKDQNATCDNGDQESATFFLKDTQLFLYNKNATQLIMADRSGMGKGILRFQYSTDGVTKYGEATGWDVNQSGSLTLAKTDKFRACPTGTAWQIWIGAEKGLTGCQNVTVQAVKESNPISCKYYSMW